MDSIDKDPERVNKLAETFLSGENILFDTKTAK
jgi:hypothetical protein